ncbi:MAG TPA: dienelactone hydrolase family protein [Candidatus Eisenbacteria bacterium]|jgi:carboxymethylenebutenolidase
MIQTRRVHSPHGWAALALAAFTGAAVWAGAPRPAHAGAMVAFTQGKSRVQGYLALPRGEGTHPAMIVIHEWWGLDDWVKQQTDSLAKHGYLSLGVDLYRGKVTRDQSVAHQLVSGLSEDDALMTLRAAADFLRGRSDVRANAIGVIGWCMGGKYSIRLAAADPGIRACVMYYGAPIKDPKAIEGIQASILGNFGGEDQGPSPAQVREFEAALKKAGKKVDFKIYPGAGHAFANVNNPWGGYREAAARDAWQRTLAFLDSDLKRGSVPKALRK